MTVSHAVSVARGRSTTTKRIAERRPISRRRRQVLGLLGVLVVLAAWEFLARAGMLNVAFASSPTLIAAKTVELLENGILLSAITSTGKLFAIGFAISLVIGLSVGVILGWYRSVSAVLNPWVAMLYAAPRIAFIPLVIVWAGAGTAAQVIIVVINAVFPILINAAAGVDAVDRQLLRVAQSFSATNWDVLRTVALPGAMPILIAGIRNGMMTALLGTVVAEYFIGLTGVGGMIFNAGLTLDTTTAFVGAVVFSLAALVLSSLLSALQAHVDRWR
jgi:ABC-type nitrate/sulfonate/bicarbonate transport system permease component